MITETSFEESIVITICRFFGELEIVHLCPGSMLRQSTQDQMKHEVTTYKKSTKNLQNVYIFAALYKWGRMFH